MSTTNIYTADELGLSESDGGKWVLVCEPHGHIIQDTNKRRLSAWRNHSDEWCGACIELRDEQ